MSGDEKELCNCGHKEHGTRTRSDGVYVQACLTKECKCTLDTTMIKKVDSE